LKLLARSLSLFVLTALGTGSGVSAQSPPPGTSQVAVAKSHHRAAPHGGKDRGDNAKPATSAATVPNVPAGRKSAAEVQTALQAQLKSGRFAGEAVHVAVKGSLLTLTGTVHRAESKGVAIHVARDVAKQSGWTDFHVDNRLEVQP